MKLSASVTLDRSLAALESAVHNVCVSLRWQCFSGVRTSDQWNALYNALPGEDDKAEYLRLASNLRAILPHDIHGLFDSAIGRVELAFQNLAQARQQCPEAVFC